MKKTHKNCRRYASVLLGAVILLSEIVTAKPVAGLEWRPLSSETGGEIRLATDSNCIAPIVPITPDKKATPSAALYLAENSLGDIWDSWSGKTSFEFLDGDHGDGSPEHPFLIKNKEQLMGLSELTAMGMVILDGNGVDYAGDYSGCSFALSGDIDLQGENWIPIGFYSDSSERGGSVENSFHGIFDGRGHTIRNFRLNAWSSYNHVGLFGSIADAEIRNVTVIPVPDTEVCGNEYTGVLAGSVTDSTLKNITVKNACLSTAGTTGGIAGEISDTAVENCDCDNLKINAAGGKELIYAGGIAGTAADSVIVDCTVSTGNGKTARIQGIGYIGGIVGYQNDCDIYNVRVSGTIGGEGSKAIGGITGEYFTGKMKVARFEGSIGNSHLGSLAREGTFIGTRKGAASNFNYIDDLAYLFADTESKVSAGVCGSEISDDNDYTYGAHIGYWHPADLYFTLMQGGYSKTVDSRYFYEELEEGILSVMDEGDERFSIDHFAPDSVGRPTRGYLVVANRIDTVANGQDFYDVASLTIRGNSMYSKEIDKDHRGAVAAGEPVYVNTAPNNSDSEKFQMEGNPYYVNGKGEKKNTAYSDASHCYTFRMPEENITVSANYQKVAVSVRVEPDTYKFTVTQTRTGNRKSPVKTTEIKNREGKLIATYINGILEQGTEVQPVTIAASIDTNNDVSDNRVRWKIDDAELITLKKNDDEEYDGYTAKMAEVTVNLDAPFFTETVAELEKKQAEENYRYRIPDTIYGAGHQNGGVAVLTAETRPSTSFEGRPCTANCRIMVTFQILDQTLSAVEGAVLDRTALDFTVTRTLEGDRTKPEERITVTAPQSLTATFSPNHFSKNEVTWTSSDPSVVTVLQDESAYKEALISAGKDSKWIQDIIAADQVVRENDPYSRIEGKGVRKAIVTVDAKDMLGSHETAECEVTVHFNTADNTRIIPVKVAPDKTRVDFDLVMLKRGGIDSETVSMSGLESQDMKAKVFPDITEGLEHTPYNREVVWTSLDPRSVTVTPEGKVAAVPDAPWILKALEAAPYRASHEADIEARTVDGECVAKCRVHLDFHAECLELSERNIEFNLVLTKKGRRSSPTWTIAGLEAQHVQADIYTDGRNSDRVVWKSDVPEIIAVDNEGNIIPIIPQESDGNLSKLPDWLKKLTENSDEPQMVTGRITAASVNGTMEESVNVTLCVSMVDKTYQEGSSGGSGGGSTGGGKGGSTGGSTGITPDGQTLGPAGLSGAVNGIWTRTPGGKWLFASGRTYADEWAYINNPYVSAGQPAAAWFRFDKEGFMVTGWYQDETGSLYYLNPVSDGTMGQMVTGWRWIDDSWYYFNPMSDGTKGKMMVSTVIDGIYMVDEKGRWIEK